LPGRKRENLASTEVELLSSFILMTMGLAWPSIRIIGMDNPYPSTMLALDELARRKRRRTYQILRTPSSGGICNPFPLRPRGARSNGSCSQLPQKAFSHQFRIPVKISVTRWAVLKEFSDELTNRWDIKAERHNCTVGERFLKTIRR